jgi:hypothetical protein
VNCTCFSTNRVVFFSSLVSITLITEPRLEGMPKKWPVLHESILFRLTDVEYKAQRPSNLQELVGVNSCVPIG